MLMWNVVYRRLTKGRDKYWQILASFHFYWFLQALNFLVKAHRTRTQTPGWENDVSQFKAVIELTVHLSQSK